jgi:chaperonin GroEL
MIEKKARAEDAIHACRGALQEGVVPGGGVALLRAAQRYAYTAGQPGFSDGQQLLIRAISEPICQIVRNAGGDVETTVQAVHEGRWDDGSGDAASHGFNAATGVFGDLYAMGIVDPCKVVITALTKAASVGALLLTTEVLVTDIPEPAQPMPQGPLHY